MDMCHVRCDLFTKIMVSVAVTCKYYFFGDIFQEAPHLRRMKNTVRLLLSKITLMGPLYLDILYRYPYYKGVENIHSRSKLRA